MPGRGARVDAARAGQRIKTDRRDAAKLARLFRAGELTRFTCRMKPRKGCAICCAAGMTSGGTCCGGATECSSC